jgi:hypothetical protein
MNELIKLKKEIEEMRNYNDELFLKLIAAEREKNLLLNEIERLINEKQTFIKQNI